jgi:phosphomevalonate kinase
MAAIGANAGGVGSSAALVTALSALLKMFGIVDLYNNY